MVGIGVELVGLAVLQTVAVLGCDLGEGDSSELLLGPGEEEMRCGQ